MILVSHVVLVSFLAAPGGAGADDIPPYPHVLPAWYERLEAALAKPIDAFELGAPTPLAEAVEALARKTGVAIVLADGADGSGEAPIRLSRVVMLPLGSVLRLLVRQTGRELTIALEPDRVIITDRPEAYPEPAAAVVRRKIDAARNPTFHGPNPAEARIEKVFRSTEVSFRFEEQPLVDAVAFLRQVTGINIVVLPEVLESDPAVDVSLASTPVSEALPKLLEPHGLDWFVHQGCALITTRAKAAEHREKEKARLAAVRRRAVAIEAIRARRIEADCRGRRPHEVVGILEKELAVPVYADPAAWATRARIESATAGTSLREIAEAIGAIGIEVVVLEDAVFLKRAAGAQ